MIWGVQGGVPPAPVTRMARYEHLPIHKKAMDLAVYLEKMVRSFSRYHKYTLGSELGAKSREIVGVIGAERRAVFQHRARPSQTFKLWLRYPEILADLSRQMFVYFVVTRNGAAPVLRGVMPPGVSAAFSKK